MQAAGYTTAMATLYVREMPDKLYKRLQRLAESQNRSITAQVIAIVEEAVAEDDERRKQRELLNAMRREIWTPPPGTPDTAKMLRHIRGYEDYTIAGLE
jgi:antitoxin FitA